MLFELAQSLRSLTASPMAGLVQEAHRMARRRLEAGGSAAPRGQVDDQRDMDDFELPGDLDANELKIIEAKLRDGAGNLKDAPPLIVRRSGGRVVVPGLHVHRLGGGHHGGASVSSLPYLVRSGVSVAGSGSQNLYRRYQVLGRASVVLRPR